MTIQDWAGLILTVLSIAAIVIGGIRWYIDLKIKPIHEAVCDIRQETKTNGGSSMRDEIKSIKKEQEDAKEIRKATNEKLESMYSILLDYIARNSR